MRDDGTNVSFSFSQDGVNFLDLYTVAKSAGYLGATGYSNLIFFINPGPGVNGLATLFVLDAVMIAHRFWCIGLLVAAVFILVGPGVANAQCTLPHTLTNGQPPDATKVMANFNALVSCINAGGSSNAIQYRSGSGALAGVGPLADGQLAVGSTGNPPQAQALTAGAGITISNGPGSIALEATSGSATAGLYRQVMSAAPTAASTGLTTWLNQSGATYADGPAGASLSAPAGADALRVRYGPAPLPPYTLTALLAATRNSTAFSEAGIGWYDGTAKFHIFSYAIGAAGFSSVLQIAK